MDALLVADRISGFEIKSDVDSLTRLPRQIEAYGAVVERAVLVVGDRHLAAGTAAVPPWWTIWGARWRKGDVVIREVRRGRLNPDLNPLAITSFMSRDDLSEALRALGFTRLSRHSADELRQLLASNVSPRETVRLAPRRDARQRPLEAPLPLGGRDASPERLRGRSLARKPLGGTGRRCRRRSRQLMVHQSEVVLKGDLAPHTGSARLVCLVCNVLDALVRLAKPRAQPVRLHQQMTTGNLERPTQASTRGRDGTPVHMHPFTARVPQVAVPRLHRHRVRRLVQRVVSVNDVHAGVDETEP